MMMMALVLVLCCWSYGVGHDIGHDVRNGVGHGGSNDG